MTCGRVFDHDKLGFSDLDAKLARRRLSIAKQPRLIIGIRPRTRNNPRSEMYARSFDTFDFLSDLVSGQDTFRDEDLLKRGDRLLRFEISRVVFHYECIVLTMIVAVAIPVRM